MRHWSVAGCEVALRRHKMNVEQHVWTAASGWASDFPGNLSRSAQLVLVFGSTDALRGGGRLAEIRAAYPNAYVLGCSTAGEIAATRVLDESIVVTAVSFEHASLRAAEISLDDAADSRDAGRGSPGVWTSTTSSMSSSSPMD